MVTLSGYQKATNNAVVQMKKGDGNSARVAIFERGLGPVKFLTTFNISVVLP